MHLFKALLFFSSLLSITFSLPAPQATPETTTPSEFIVVLKTQERVRTNEQHATWLNGLLAAEESSAKTSDFDFGTWQAYAVKGSDALKATLAADGDVDWVQPVREFKASGQNNAPTVGLRRSSSRAPPAANAPYLFVNSAGEGVDAYILDTGIKETHPEFEGRAIFGASFINNGEKVDGNGHGTHVAGTIGSKSFGMAPKVTLIGVRVLDAQGSGPNTGILSGIEFILNNFKTRGRPAVVNMSLGGPGDRALDRAVSTLIANGVNVVAAAGNDGADACGDSPARVPEVITVGAIDPRNDAQASFSNTGTCVDLNAPGVQVLSTWIGNSNQIGDNGITNAISGTSMACPHTAGAVALLLSEQKGLTPAQVSSTLTKFATSGVLKVRNQTPNLLLFTGADQGFVQSQLQNGAVTTPVNNGNGNNGNNGNTTTPPKRNRFKFFFPSFGTTASKKKTTSN
ncbi:hypothetical protein HK098_003031 [Nowakowskiella sp. JEL0407]|nr:hypothetical protein HK098_003031 [Nowakowskiella sp. JEL0407]